MNKLNCLSIKSKCEILWLDFSLRSKRQTVIYPVSIFKHVILRAKNFLNLVMQNDDKKRSLGSLHSVTELSYSALSLFSSMVLKE